MDYLNLCKDGLCWNLMVNTNKIICVISQMFFFLNSIRVFFSNINGLWIKCWKALKNIKKKTTFNRGVPCLKNVQINRSLGIISSLRWINKISQRVCKIRNLMEKQAFLAHPTIHASFFTHVSWVARNYMMQLFIIPISFSCGARAT